MFQGKNKSMNFSETTSKKSPFSSKTRKNSKNKFSNPSNHKGKKNYQIGGNSISRLTVSNSNFISKGTKK